jgi:hypothetical protein
MNAPMMRIAALLTAIFVITSLLTVPTQILFNLNCVLVSMSIGVSIAYLPVAWDALTRPKLTRADVLGLGIFLAWAGGGVLRAIWALNKIGVDWTNSDLSNIGVGMLICGAVCHMTAPQMLDERPRRKVWVGCGVWVAIGVLLIFLALLPPLTFSR